MLSAFTGVCLLECVAGWLLWTGRTAGRSLSWALLPVELAFWVGFALPFGPPLGATRTVLILRHRAVTAVTVTDGARSGEALTTRER